MSEMSGAQRGLKTRIRRRLAAVLVPVLRDVLINGVAGWAGTPRTARLWILRTYGVRAGRCNIFPGCWFGGRDISIGDATFVNRGCVFENSAPIVVGGNCSLGLEVMLLTSTHHLGRHEQRAGPLTGRPVSIGDGVWIGARAVVLPGVSIGDGCVVAAGSVVADDCDADGLYAGVPARRVRAL